MKRKNYGSWIMLAICVIGFYSCDDKQEEEISVNDFTGYYKITSLKADISVDLNNDGLQSSDLYNEMTEPYYLANPRDPDYTPLPMYNFNQISSCAEVRPTESQSTSIKLLLLNLPYQYIAYSSLLMYVHDLSYYFYDLDENDNVVLKEKLGDTPEVQVTELERLDKDNFKVIYNARIYDFVSKEWKETSVKALYERTSI